MNAKEKIEELLEASEDGTITRAFQVLCKQKKLI